MTASVNKKRIVALIVSTVVIVSLFAALNLPKNQAAATEETVRVNLESLRESIDATEASNPLLMFSSNPYDYVSDGKNEYYNKIVALGPEALPSLEKALVESPNNGLNEYIIAIAIEDVAKADVRGIEKDPFAWSDAKEFEKKWLEINKTLPERINAIVFSEELDNERKLEQLKPYGLLAMPELEDALGSGDLDKALAATLQNHVDDLNL